MATLSSPTLQRLIRDARLLLNQPRAENSRWSDTELGEYINDAVKLYFLHINEMAEGQFDKVIDLDLTANTETVNLPADCFSIKVLYRKQNTVFQPLAYRNNFIESYDSQTASGNTYEPSYYLRGEKLVLRPIPGANETAGLKLEYTAFPETLVVGGDVLSSGISPIFKELVVLYSVYKAKVKDDLVNGSNTRLAAQQLLDAQFVTFKHAVTERSKYPTFIVPFNP